MSLNNVLDVIVKSFNRPDKLITLVNAWNLLYPDISLTICDDSTIDMPFSDSIFSKHHIVIIPEKYKGVSYGRNYGIDNTNKEYILFLDDDFVPQKRTDLNKFMTLFEIDRHIGLVGGVCGKRSSSAVIQGGQLELKNGLCKKTCLGDTFELYKGIAYRYCSITDLFFVAKRELFSDIRWDDNLKIAEHTDFFLQMEKTNWRALFTPEVQIGHDQSTLFRSSYDKYRYGNFGYFKELYWKKYNINREIYCDKDGNVLKEWITSYARIDYNSDGSISPYSSKLDRLVLLEVLDDKLHKDQARIIAVGKNELNWEPGKIIEMPSLQDPIVIQLGGLYQNTKLLLVKSNML